MGAKVSGKFIISPNGGAFPMGLMLARRNPTQIIKRTIQNNVSYVEIEKGVRYILACAFAGDPGDSISIKFESLDGSVKKAIPGSAKIPSGTTDGILTARFKID